MNTLLDEPDTFTFVELQEQLGGVPARRILMRPPPGTATEADVTRLLDKWNKRCELIDGTLVEKAMGMRESGIAMQIGHRILTYLEGNDIGGVSGEQGTLKVRRGRVRIPDVAFFRYDSIPGGRIPNEKIPFVAPTLSVEVLSESNTLREMEMKRHDLFDAGTRLIWEIDPETRSAEVFTSAEESTHIGEDGTLDGGDVLPGFRLSLKELFAKVDRMFKT